MRGLFVLLLYLLTAPWAHAAPALISPAELQRQLAAQTSGSGKAQTQAQRPSARLRLIDIRDPISFEQQHLPGAIHLPYSLWRNDDAHNPGQVASVAQLAHLLSQKGLARTDHLVVISSGEDAFDFGAAARVYWTLKYLGVRQLSLLQGGVWAWDEANLPLDFGPEPETALSLPLSGSASFVPEVQNQWLAQMPEVLDGIQKGQTQLVDARPKAFFLGQSRVPQAKAAGTLPGALHLDSDRWFNDRGGLLLPLAQAQALAQPLGLKDTQPTVVFCNTGHLAAINWFVLSEVLGHKQVKLYPGSMVDWTQHPKALPMANEPHRIQQLWLDARMWYRQRFE